MTTFEKTNNFVFNYYNSVLWDKDIIAYDVIKKVTDVFMNNIAILLTNQNYLRFSLNDKWTQSFYSLPTDNNLNRIIISKILHSCPNFNCIFEENLILPPSLVEEKFDEIWKELHG